MTTLLSLTYTSPVMPSNSAPESKSSTWPLRTARPPETFIFLVEPERVRDSDPSAAKSTRSGTTSSRKGVKSPAPSMAPWTAALLSIPISPICSPISRGTAPEKVKGFLENNPERVPWQLSCCGDSVVEACSCSIPNGNAMSLPKESSST